VKIKVRYFSYLKDEFKTKVSTFSVKNGTTVSELLIIIRLINKSIDLKNIMIAVNAKYADCNAVLKDGDIVALLPPVGGG